jgi:hypothetical protein
MVQVGWSARTTFLDSGKSNGLRSPAFLLVVFADLLNPATSSLEMRRVSRGEIIGTST